MRVATLLDAGMPAVTAALQRVETLAEVTRGALAFRAAHGSLPAVWPAEGGSVELVVRPLHLPLGWHHTIRVQPVHRDRCRYEDDVLLDAGPLTPVAVVLTSAFYRWRQLRWRRLARTLAEQRSASG